MPLAVLAILLALAMPAAADGYFSPPLPVLIQPGDDEPPIRPDAGVIDNSGDVPQDVAVADFNHDGIPDLAIAYAYDDAIRWFYGTGDGAFEPGGDAEVGIHDGLANDLPRALLAADFDRDGFNDLAVLCSGNPNLQLEPSLGILYGAPTGEFEPFQTVAMTGNFDADPLFSLALTAALIDGDDRLDLIVGHFDSRQISIITHAERRRWRAPQVLPVETAGGGPTAILAVDVNFDGANDLIVVNRRDLQIWRGNGSTQFPFRHTLDTGGAFTAAVVGDFDRDGAWDLAALEGQTQQLKLHLGLQPNGAAAQHTINLTNAAEPAPRNGPVDLVRLDADGDGRDDLALIYLLSGGGDLYLGRHVNTGAPLAFARHFTTAQAPRALAAADLNLDGLEDLAIVHEGDQSDPANNDLVIDLNPLSPRISPIGAAPVHSTPGLGLSPYLDRPRGLCWDAQRQALWCIDRKERQLVRLSPDGETQAAYALAQLPANVLQDPADLAVDGAGQLWITDRLSGKLHRLYIERGELHFSAHFPTAGAGLLHPTGIAFDPARNRLLVSDEAAPSLAAFSTSGALLWTWDLLEVAGDGGPTPALDLAWDAETQQLWATRAHEAENLAVFELPDASHRALPAAEISGQTIDHILRQSDLRSIAFDPAGRRFWLLTDSGALLKIDIEAAPGEPPSGDPQYLVRHLRELSLLRDIRAIAVRRADGAPLPAGEVWLGSSGLTASLVRLPPDGGPPEIVPLNRPNSLGGSTVGPISIAGLSVLEDRIYILDDRAEMVRVVDLAGQLQGSLGATALRGRRPRGLHAAPGVAGEPARLTVGTVGRLIELSASGQNFAERPIPTSAPPGSLSAGERPGEIMLYSPARRQLSYFSDANNLRQTFILSNAHSPRFTPRAAAHGPGGLVFVGVGDPTMLSTQIHESTATRHWRNYR